MSDKSIPKAKIKRKHAYAIRSALHEAEQKASEKEKDLSSVACVALWDLDVRKLIACLRRLVRLDARWEKVMEIAQAALHPVFE